jgi:hypothetical protein
MRGTLKFRTMSAKCAHEASETLERPDPGVPAVRLAANQELFPTAAHSSSTALPKTGRPPTEV